jgi:hypothetical protein
MIKHILFINLIFLSLYNVVFAGPPFRTDDPEPVEYMHWEVYLASQGSLNRDEISLTAPQIEINYGIFPNIQLHLIAPFQLEKPEGKHSHYGYADTEFGTKIRFIQETNLCPQIGFFPLVLLPTGNKNKGLGSGEAQAFIPIWFQKDFEPWLTYGGGGYQFNPGSGNKNYWFIGWELQRELSEYITIGLELFYQTPDEIDGKSKVGFNVGTIVNFSLIHHILFSIGREHTDTDNTLFYISYQLTFGPKSENTKD